MYYILIIINTNELKRFLTIKKIVNGHTNL